jgi:hypothetical protein
VRIACSNRWTRRHPDDLLRHSIHPDLHVIHRGHVSEQLQMASDTVNNVGRTWSDGENSQAPLYMQGRMHGRKHTFGQVSISNANPIDNYILHVEVETNARILDLKLRK